MKQKCISFFHSFKFQDTIGSIKKKIFSKIRIRYAFIYKKKKKLSGKKRTGAATLI